MRDASPLGIAVLGSGIIAVTYGLARFAFGLFLPSIRADMGLSPTAAGIIGALPFVSFVVAILVAPRVAGALGVRRAAIGATAFAVAGLLAIAQAPGPAVLALGVVTCGISTGLSTPVLADCVHAAVRAELRGRVNATINAGTSLGIAAAMPAAIWWGESWRSAYAGFAVLAALGVAAAVIRLPGRRTGRTEAPDRPPSPPVSRRQWLDIARLSALAGAMGFVSALYWVFAPDFAVHGGGLSAGQSAWMWLAVAAGGLAGVGAGDLLDRYGAAMSHALALTVLSASLALLAADPGAFALALVSAAAFGAAYMTLTGLCLVDSVRIMTDRPALGPVIPFLAIACGQIAGSPVGGWAIAAHGHAAAFGAFAAFGLGIAVLSPRLLAPAAAGTGPAGREG